MTRPIFIGGTSSHAGKSWMTTAICAWLRRQGVRVTPFKAQNMSNNSYPCRVGGEIGRAQVAQAWACGLEPEPAMNPILLKPNSDGGSQVVVNGHVWKNLTAREYYQHRAELFKIVMAAYADLASRFDVVVIEGAGSVSELNLRQHDLVNLELVKQLSAAWLLVGDIERGGIFASITGTVNLLTAQERSLLRAFAVNKFRGDRSLFDDGRVILEEKAGCPCLGVFPYAADIHLDDEDSLGIHSTVAKPVNNARCGIVQFPRISNTTDFRLLGNASWITRPLNDTFDFIFLPGTKNTIGDLTWLRSRQLDRWLVEQHARGATLIGICGGFQMLGETISDPFAMESGQREAQGLGVLPLKTTLTPQKVTQVREARTLRGARFSAYEIHLGETVCEASGLPPFAFLEDGSSEGVRAERVIGTYLHGAFEHIEVLAEIGIDISGAAPEQKFEKLADWFDPFSQRFRELFLDC
jgi:adenosylcobyric acid synthase